MQMTDKALEIRNCCCLITIPWTSEEIGDAWGLTGEQIRRHEEGALKKLQNKGRINLEENSEISNKKRPAYPSFTFRRNRRPKYGIFPLQHSCGR